MAARALCDAAASSSTATIRPRCRVLFHHVLTSLEVARWQFVARLTSWQNIPQRHHDTSAAVPFKFVHHASPVSNES